MQISQKIQKLTETIRKAKHLAVAFSGGVDSSLLLITARDILGDDAMAFISVGLPHARRESNGAVRLAESFGVRYREVPTGRLDREAFTVNNEDRCYQCKKLMWTEIADAAGKAGLFCLADGVCADDLDEFRPGLAAGREMGVISPLAEAGLTKQEIRILAREAGLANWDKPSTPCLATRIPYGICLTTGILAMIEQAEDYLIGMGFSQCRVRYHDGMARIEVPPDRIEIMASNTVREKINAEFKNIGFSLVAVDLNGYVSGSMDNLSRSNQ